MKEKFLIFSLITILGFLPYNIFCQYREAETFLEGFEGTGVYIDTTGISDVLELIGNFSGKVYATKGFILKIEEDIFDKDAIQSDTFDISAIKFEFLNRREQFQKIEEKFGKFYFDQKKESLQGCAFNKEKYYHLSFDKLQNADTIIKYFKDLTNFNLVFDYFPKFPVYVPNDRMLKPSSKPIDIQYQNSDPFYDMNFHNRGFGWNIYSLNLPLAWEISTGDRQTVLSVYDVFGDAYTPHPDLPVKTTAGDPTGNWIYLNANNFGDSDFDWNDDIPINTYPPGKGWCDHGLTVLSMAISKRDNDSYSQPAEGGHVGTCPDCLGIAFSNRNRDDLAETYHLYDTDLEINGFIKPINTISYSWSGIWWPEDFDVLINNGVVVLGAAANNLPYPCNCDGYYKEQHTFGYKSDIDNYRYFHTTYNGIGANVYTPINNDPTKDYKIISVAGMMDGDLYDVNCVPWKCDFQQPPTSKGKEKFATDFIFSPGVNKFSINPDATLRATEKQQAYIDVVAPAVHQATATNSESAIPCRVYTYGSTEWKDCQCDPELWTGDPEGWQECVDEALEREYDAYRKYQLDVTGTSQAVPQVNGIVGLMNSISKYLGVPLQQNGLPITGVNVQRTAYDIITFTTKKIEDDGESPEPFWCKDWSNTNFLNFTEKPSQPYYLIQHNDKLLRTWAQRVGFGKVNAYRALAHTIRQKGEYEYLLNQSPYTLLFASADGNGDSRGYVNPSGKKIMHWGSKVKEGALDFELPSFRGPTSSLDANPYNVLDWGGTSLPGEFHNNQGITRINNTTETRTEIIVPTDCILAIDGVLISDQPNACHYVITSGTSQESSGLILVEGYIKDIEVAGNLRIGDVILESTIDNGIQNEPGCLSFNCCDGSEIYGDIKVINKGFLYAWRGFTMFP